MRQIVFSRSAPPKVVTVPAPALKPGCVLVRTEYSAVSVGTERAAAAGSQMNVARKAFDRPQQIADLLAGVARDGVATTIGRVKHVLEKWLPGGYSTSGVVVAVGAGVTEFNVGDRVACAGGGYAVHADLCAVPRRLVAKVPEGVPLDAAAFTTIGAVALHGFRIGEAHLGESVLVLGLGIIGQLACQIAAAAGCRVIAMDLNADRVERARALAGCHGIVGGGGAEISQLHALTGDRGVDVAFVCAASSGSQPVLLAATATRDRGRVVVVGDVGLHLDRQTLYDKELDLRVARSYGPGRYDADYEERGRDYPYPYVRWTEQRNFEAFLELIAAGRVRIAPLITHRFPVADATQAFAALSEPGAQAPIGAVFEYQAGRDDEALGVQRLRTHEARPAAAPGIALVGPGAFARNILIPALARHGVRPRTIVGTRGAEATYLAQSAGAQEGATDFAAVLADPQIDTVVIATRHDSHASLVCEALGAGKHVYVEKPLALSVEELERVASAYESAGRSLHVGFNRRFAPMSRAAREFLPAGVAPVMLYRINAGAVEASHWTRSAEDGGGRIIGEVCHFVDLLQFFAGAKVTTVYARAQRAERSTEQDVVVSLGFANGAVGTIVYTAHGSARLGKEYVELFAGGKCAVIDDFCELRLIDDRGVRRRRQRQDKGFADEMGAFLAHLRSGGPAAIPFDDLMTTSLATIAIVESCRTGAAVTLPVVGP